MIYQYFWRVRLAETTNQNEEIKNMSGLKKHIYEEIGNGVHPGTRNKLKSEGIPCGNHRARHIEKSDYNEFDYIIGMDSANIRNIGRIVGNDRDGKVYKLLHFAGEERDIADPWYTGNFDATYDDVLKGCTALLNEILDTEKFTKEN